MGRELHPTTYILAGKRNGTLYVGVTSDLYSRICTHRAGTFKGFTMEYHVHRLVYFEKHATMRDAIKREKSIKGWPRRWKLSLIEQRNPEWRDLAVEIGLSAV
jgi:putative endonuclease